MNPRHAFLWIGFAAGAYAFAQALWHWPTPLGQKPALDGMENLLLARRIAEGTLAAEPFYRAMLYPWLLSLGFRLGLSEAALPFFAGGVGIAAHVATALAAARLGRRLNGETGALLAGLAVGLNPVLVHFALDPLDIVPATALFAWSLVFLLDPPQGRLLPALGASAILLALAALARPHFMATLPAGAWLAWRAAAGARDRPPGGSRGLAVWAAAAALPLLAYGAAQAGVSGRFGILPWQGAYNLWVSNGPGANGLYYAQSVAFHHTGEHRNPARLEDAWLYRQETGREGSIDERTRYWRRRTLEAIAADPLRWLGLMGWKLYALSNDHEQYNNKSYEFHKRRSPWLRYNPIGWGLLLGLGAAGALALWPSRRRAVGGLLLAAAFYSAGVLLYMASGRFRVPLHALLAALASGLPLAGAWWRAAAPARRAGAAAGLAALLALAFSSFGGIDSRKTWIQDALLLADASARSGRDAETRRWAREALERDPENAAALRLLAIASYNLATQDPAEVSQGEWAFLAARIRGAGLDDPAFSLASGAALWNAGQREAARTRWREASRERGLEASTSLAALLWTTPEEPTPRLEPELLQAMGRGERILLQAALARRGALPRELLQARRERLERAARGLNGALPAAGGS